MEHKESKLQILCVQWFKMQYPKEIIFAIPNARKVSRYLGNIYTKEGVLAGVSDLFIMAQGVIGCGEELNVYAGIFIEMKSEKGKLSDSQKLFVEKAKEKGYYVAVCNSFESFQNEVNKYLK